jgi:CheY-like chemotaxis protein
MEEQNMFEVDDNEFTIEDIENFLNGGGADTSSAEEGKENCKACSYQKRVCIVRSYMR